VREGKERIGKEAKQETNKLFRWDKNKDSLSSTLHEVFPEIFPKTASLPIPNCPPS
jgi:hypothetical protein